MQYSFQVSFFSLRYLRLFDNAILRYFAVLELNFVETWGDMYYLGLTGLQILGAQGKVIDILLDMLQVCNLKVTDISL